MIYRPLYHFSPPQGWTNDPNGLVYSEGWWHLFYQHMPTETHWGPMHWGHAVSRDLTHWEYRAIALYPDELGAIFSGSAAVSTQGELVACFTHASENRQVQSLAFSTDGGHTWHKDEHNPVLTLDRPEFRDPKIFRYEDAWRMIVAAGFEVQIYASPDLRSWTLLSAIVSPQPEWIWECPDLIHVDGRWVLIASFIRPGATAAQGSGTYYWLGDFDGEAFTPSTQPRALGFGPDDYAAVSWSDAPDERKIIIGWMSHWSYAAATPTDGEGWRGAMTLPRELAVRGDTLHQNPPREIETRRAAGIAFDEANLSYRGDAYEIEVEIEVPEYSAVGFRLRCNAEEHTEVAYHPATRELQINREQSGQTDFHGGFAGVFTTTLAPFEGALKLRIFVDRCSLEVFAQDGEAYGAALIFPASDALGIEFFGEGAPVRGTLYPLG